MGRLLDFTDILEKPVLILGGVRRIQLFDIGKKAFFVCTNKYEVFMTQDTSILTHRLNFAANPLARLITRKAEEEFRTTGLSPSHTFLMMLVTDKPGIG